MANKSFVFRFDDVEVREREFTLVKAGQVLAVEPKAFRALLFLLHNPQRLISKEELLNGVWGDAAVTEGSLTRCIWLLRSLLGDDIRSPRYIETVATVGYRWVCKLEVAEGDSEEPAATKEPDGPDDVGKTAGGRRRLWGWLLAGGGLLALCLAGSTWYLRSPLPSLRVTGYGQLTHDIRPQDLFGTDGARLYLDIITNPHFVAQVPVTGGEITRLNIPLEDPFLDDVSPDGSSFLVESGSEAGLWSVQSMGSSLRRLTDVGIDISGWSSDGKSVIYSTANGDINVVRSDGADAHRLVNLPYDRHSSSFFPPRFAWSPDGNTIRFDRNDRIYEMKPDGSGLHQMLPEWHTSSAKCCGQWTPDGRFFLFLVYDPPLSTNFFMQPASQIWALGERRSPFRVAAEPVQLSSGPTRWGRPVPGKDGKKIFARGLTLSGELVHLDPQSHQLLPFLGGISAQGVTFSPDGRFVAYVTYPEGVLWRANRDGSNRLQLTDPPLYPSSPRWSPDGAQILFFAASNPAEARTYLVSSQGGAPQRVLPDDDESQGTPDWSPDGSKIVFDSFQTEAGTEKHVLRVLDLISRQIVTLPGDGWDPRWSPDGRFIAASSGDRKSLTVFDLQARRWLEVKKVEAERPTWSRDGKFIYFLFSGSDPGVYRIRPSGGEAERVVDLKGFHLKGFHPTALWEDWMGLDPDGNPMLMRDTGSQNIYALTLEEK